MAEPVVRPMRIGLVGGECTGKSTLARALARTLPACVVDEHLRERVQHLGRTPLWEEQEAIMAAQQDREDAAAATCPHPWLIADPAPLMTAVYSRLYFDDDSLTVEAARLATGYRLVVWCGTDLPWQPDGSQRDGPAYRDRADALIADLVRDHLMPSGIPVLRVAGPVPQRVEAVGRAWQLRGLAGPT